MQEKKAKKDYDGDGKVESGAKEYRGVIHNKIQKAKGGKADGQDTSSVKEHHQKDADGNIVEHEDEAEGTPSSVEEAKIDKIDPKNKRNRRNVAKFGKQTRPYDPPTKEMKTSMGKFMQKHRQDMHKAKRGVKKEEVVLEADKKGKGSGTKDACYHKVKSRYSRHNDPPHRLCNHDQHVGRTRLLMHRIIYWELHPYSSFHLVHLQS